MQYYNNLITSVEKTSDDIHTQIGCVITAKDGHILSMGTNKFTVGITATAENVERPEKYDWIEHAERNAIYSAAKNGVRLANSTMYLLDFPCVECSRAIAQSGITTLYTGLTKVLDEERYKFNKSRTILAAAGVELIEGWRPE